MFVHAHREVVDLLTVILCQDRKFKHSAHLNGGSTSLPYQQRNIFFFFLIKVIYGSVKKQRDTEFEIQSKNYPQPYLSNIHIFLFL
jgi:hypothetical protein